MGNGCCLRTEPKTPWEDLELKFERINFIDIEINSLYEEFQLQKGNFTDPYIEDLTGNGKHRQEYIKYMKFLMSNQSNKCHIKRLGLFLITQSQGSVIDKAKVLTFHLMSLYGGLPEDIYKLCSDVVFIHCNASLEAFKDNMKPEFKQKMLIQEQTITNYCKRTSEEYIQFICSEYRFDKDSEMQCNVVKPVQYDFKKQALSEEQKRHFINKFLEKNFEKFTRKGCLMELDEEAIRSSNQTN
jgi:hypothetical protein